MNFTFINPAALDDSPLFVALKESCKGAIALAGKAVTSAAEITSSVVAGIGNAAGGVAFGAAALGSSWLSNDGPAIEAPVRQKELEITAPPTNKHEVPMCELGSFSAPTFGGVSRGGAGIGM